jgi:nitrogen fixation protein NifT
MKIMLRMHEGRLSVYVAKKDLEAFVVEQQSPDLWGGWIRLNNGWVFELPVMPAETKLPISIEATRTST